MLMLSIRYKNVQYILSGHWPMFRAVGQWNHDLNVFVPAPGEVFTRDELRALSNAAERLIKKQK